MDSNQFSRRRPRALAVSVIAFLTCFSPFAKCFSRSSQGRWRGITLNSMLRHDYSLSERALGFWFTLTLGILAVTSLALRFVTRPISCWTPAHFTSASNQYCHDVCFQQSLIVHARDGTEFDAHLDGPKPQHTYHQWVPFALGIAAMLCLLPHFLWRMLSAVLWLDTHTLTQTLADNQRYNAAGRHVMLKDSALVVLAGLRGGNCMLTAAAVGRKVLVLMVCVLQLILIVVLFQPQLGAEDDDSDDEKNIGGEEERDYNASIPLPELFFCDVTVRKLVGSEVYRLQCINPLAQVYSKGFTFLFYLFLLLALCCMVDLLTVVSRVAIPGLRDSSLQRYLAVSEADTDPQRSAVLRRFLDSLGMDGRLVVAVTADVCGPLAAADLTNHLWTSFRSSSRPGMVVCGPVHGPAPHTLVSGVPPPPSAASASTARADASGDPDAIPLIPVANKGPEMKGPQS